MKLFIDIGNSRVKWGVQGEEQTFRLMANGSASHKEFDPAAVLDKLEDGQKLTSIWVSSVADRRYLQKVCDAFYDACQLDPYVVSVSTSAGGLFNGYEKQQQLGVDRWMAAIGARQCIEQGNLIVVDAGTAVNIEVVTDDNVYQGGVIFPGFRLLHDSLVGNTAGIESKILDNNQLIGKNTEECVNSGVGYGLVGAVDNIVLKMQAALTSPASVILSGGDAVYLGSKCSFEFIAEPDLVLMGVFALANQEH